MSQPAGQLVDQLLKRTRDPWGIAVQELGGRQFVRDLLTHAQWMVNLASPSVLGVCAMPTHRMRVLYDLATLDLTEGDVVIDRDDLLRVDRIQLPNDGEDVTGPIEWTSFQQRDRGWVRHVGPQPRLWARLGRDILALYPARDIDASVSLHYVKRTARLTSDDMLTEVRDDRLPAVLALTEALLLTQRRLFPPAITALTTMQRTLERLAPAGGTGVAGFGTGGLGDAA